MIAQIDAVLAGIGDSAARQLGGQVQSICLFGSYGQPYYQPAESDVNLLLLLEDGADVHAVRDWFRPIWQEHGSWLRRGPWVARLAEFHRFVRLVPGFAEELGRNGRFLHGDLPELPPIPSPDPHEAMARQATEALSASSALFPGLMAPPLAEARRLALRRLTRQLWQAPIPEGETAVATFARMRQILDSKINRLPAARFWHNEKVPVGTTLLLPGAQAIFQQGPYMVIALASLNPWPLQEANQERLIQRLQGKCEGVMLTTAVQLSLSLVYDNPLGLVLKSYRHNWGLDLLANLQTSQRQTMRQIAYLATTIGMIDLPQAHFTGSDADLPTLIHDFQNKLLNLRLQHELLHRLGYSQGLEMPEPLPDREASLQQRLEAIYRQLVWWSSHYTVAMDQAAA
jgi:hypothetical protein